MKLKIDIVRHCCYLLGNNPDESLANVRKYDKIDKDSVKRIILLQKLREKCKCKLQLQHVDMILANILKKVTDETCNGVQ